MKKIGFDNDKYIATQSAHIKERIAHFGGKLYLEFGGKLFDDYHASRVLRARQQGSHAVPDEGRRGDRHRYLGRRH